MQPRLPKSKKWSSLPKELLEQISSIFNENFAKQLDGAQIKSEGRIYTSEILLSIGFVKEGSIKQTNFISSMDYNKSKDNVLSLVHIAVDSIGSMFENYFNDPETEFPLSWTSFKIDQQEVFLLMSGENSDLEKKADELLNIDNSNLVQGEDSEISAEELKSNLGIKE